MNDHMGIFRYCWTQVINLEIKFVFVTNSDEASFGILASEASFGFSLSQLQRLLLVLLLLVSAFP